MYFIIVALVLIGGIIKNFTYKFSWHYNLGRVLIAGFMVFFGYNMILQGSEFYLPYIQALLKLGFPDSKFQGRFSDSYTYSQLFTLVVQAIGCTFCAGGFFIAINFRKIGCTICILATCFLLATQDNPLLLDHLKPAPAKKEIEL